MFEKFVIHIKNDSEEATIELPDGITQDEAREVFRNHFADQFGDDFTIQLWRHDMELVN